MSKKKQPTSETTTEPTKETTTPTTKKAQMADLSVVAGPPVKGSAPRAIVERGNVRIMHY